jgi:hypothetical protein
VSIAVKSDLGVSSQPGSGGFLHELSQIQGSNTMHPVWTLPRGLMHPTINACNVPMHIEYRTGDGMIRLAELGNLKTFCFAPKCHPHARF